MATEIKRTTDPKRLLKLVPMVDDAIDWELSYPDVVDPVEGDDGKPSLTEARKIAHVQQCDLTQLRFIEGRVPTLFVFKHPHRVDVARELRQLVYQLPAAVKGGNAKPLDAIAETWQIAFIGTEEGLDGGALSEAPRRGSRLPDDYIQALTDSGVFEALGGAVLSTFREGPFAAADEDRKKK